ncbi:MAG: aminotransferase class V-fold PLP-dependent enzyme [Dehalococcoidales bacterium]|nr:aminotransferase class V-fold PLP-dependent enzyme [Dehalococcoidales bacterium]
MNEYIYLNNSATSYPKPTGVLSGVSDFLHKLPFHHARAGFTGESGDVVLECRKQLAALFNVPDPSRIVFSSGATESLNTALYGIILRGKHVVTTAVEHNSVLRPLKTMEKSGIITLSIVECDENGFVPAGQIADAITGQTGAVVVNHCSNVTGITNDLAAIGQIAGRKSIPFIVDASQSAGVYAIDVQSMNIDILVFAGHKSLYGMQGIGGMYIRQGLDVKPLKVGGTGVRSDYLYQPESLPMFYEAGTQNLPGIVSLYNGVRYVLKEGIDAMRERKEELVSRMRDYLSNCRQVTLFPGPGCEKPTTIFCFNVAGIDPEDIGYILENNFGIVVRSGLHCAPLIHRHIGTFPSGSVRISPSHFTSDAEVEAFNNALMQIIQMAD